MAKQVRIEMTNPKNGDVIFALDEKQAAVFARTGWVKVDKKKEKAS